MSTGVVVADWIKRLVDEERKRDAVRIRGEEAVARKADLVRVRGRRLIDELRATVTRDVEAFREEFVGDRARTIVLEATDPEGGFMVCKPESPAVSLTIAPQLQQATVGCLYLFTPTNGLPPREHRIELVFVCVEGDTVLMKHNGTGQVFASADVLSEFLLVPVLTGRPR